jgi:hypothetical protein
LNRFIWTFRVAFTPASKPQNEPFVNLLMPLAAGAVIQTSLAAPPGFG